MPNIALLRVLAFIASPASIFYKYVTHMTWKYPYVSYLHLIYRKIAVKNPTKDVDSVENMCNAS